MRESINISWRGSSLLTGKMDSKAFRPLFVEGNTLVFEQPQTVAERNQFGKSSPPRNFLIAYFSGTQSPVQVDLHLVTLKDGQIQRETVERLEESNLLACRREWVTENPLLLRGKPFANPVHNDGLGMSVINAGDHAQKRAVELVGSHLAQSSTAFPQELVDNLRTARETTGEMSRRRQRIYQLTVQQSKVAEELARAQISLDAAIKIAQENKLRAEADAKQKKALADQVAKAEAYRADIKQDLFQLSYAIEHPEDDKFYLNIRDDKAYEKYIPLISSKARYTDFWGREKIDLAKVKDGHTFLYNHRQNDLSLASKALKEAKQKYDSFMADLTTRTNGNALMGDPVDKARKTSKRAEESKGTVDAQLAQETASLSHAQSENQRASDAYLKIERSPLGRTLSELPHEPFLIIEPARLERIKGADEALGFKPNIFLVTLRDPETFEVLKSGKLAIGSNWDSHQTIALVDHDRDLTLETVLNTPFYTVRGAGENATLEKEGKTLQELLGLINDGATKLQGLKRSSIPLSQLGSPEKRQQELERTGLSRFGALSEADARVIYAPGLVNTIGNGPLAAVMPDAARKLLVKQVPEVFQEALLKKELGTQTLFSLYPLEFLAREFPEALFHEQVHNLDLNRWHIAMDKPEKKAKLEAEFDQAFPKLLEEERASTAYQKAFNEFLNTQPEDQEKLLNVPKEVALKRVSEIFDEQYFGEAGQTYRNKIREKWLYYHKPAEALAWAAQVAYLRDEEHLGFEDILRKIKRMSGGHPEAQMANFEVKQLRFFYDLKDLSVFAEDLRDQAKRLAE